ncbi:ABC-type transport auxiliary lipoprotein family protein [Pseudomonas sp. TTU2014-080ASC]|uniref:ABC-type transport auxiliary lipoprotein family protein n=1 Tax=Pseudomonas sp. TTU2014-080ASC TaxID=1729724 RepID=UPI000718585A|nr:ABC-type transport auxiliary lipoprotein family protein [Pseudomonas sp. TTU2014-080ASC]KRW61335.1 hypothetical protein AO726_08395 [Pseudomonas sp. TTU2014-080ASC]
MKPFLLLLCLSLFSGCSILPKSEPLDIYLLPASALPVQSPAVSWSLRINRPDSEQLFDGTRIVVLPQAGVVNAYQGVRWSERTPKLLRNRLLDAFRDDGRIQALSNDEQNLQADLELVSSLRRFNSQYQDGQVQVHIQLDAQLVNVRDKSIVASQRFTSIKPAVNSEIASVVQAFGHATDALSQQIVAWALASGSSALATGERN